MKKSLLIVLPLCVTALIQSCAPQTKADPTSDVRIDQCGYMTGTPKMAFVEGSAKLFKVLNSDGEVCYSDSVQAPTEWIEAGCNVCRLDFSSLDIPGIYRIVVDDTLVSYNFAIAANPYVELQQVAVRAFYYNRASMAIDSLYGGIYARAAGHPDTAVMVHSSAATKKRPEGTIISSPGGWYDAGDYNKYIVNSSISTYTMMLTAKLFPDAVAAQNLNIPESDNDIPDFIDETLYNLRWMLTMQDPNDGGVYNKLTTLNFEGFIRPNECKNQRYVVAKGTAATLDLAATAAFAARFLPTVNKSLVPLADSCRIVAEKAMAWAKKNPNVVFHNPEGVSTGEYGDDELSDEWYWAASEMYLLTGDEQQYGKYIAANSTRYGVPTWGYVGILGDISLLLDDNDAIDQFCESSISAIADSLVAEDAASPVNLSLKKFEWGSNSDVANEAMLKLVAYKISGEEKYRLSALNDLHYILGRNGTGYSYVTGIGSRQSMNPHHRPSASDDIEAPVPGFLVGGPNIIVPTDCAGIDDLDRGPYPAKAYADQECSYSTNEIAINWNAPLAFLVYGVQK